jgi:glycosyltransferase involved in cell wall biosynthesis
MNITEKDSVELEILVSTQQQSTLDFLYFMFQNNNISNYNILVINQTTQECLLETNKPNIRVINSFEKGLSKSRNLALKKAKGKYCLIADDDIVYLENFHIHILKAYKEIPHADILTFKTLTTQNKPYSKYPEVVKKIDKFYRKILSIEISFKRDALLKNEMKFDENFGLGSIFEDSENYIFLKKALSIQLHAFFVPHYIVIHEPKSSSDDIGLDRFIFSRSALSYKQHGAYAYIFALKLIFAIFRRKIIKTNEVIPKLKVAFNGIKTYKQIMQE